VETSEEKFLTYFSAINRKGASDLLNYLKSTDFFTAPASSKYHNSSPGGLVDHSVKVCDRLANLTNDYPPETIAIVSLLHDICKANYYKIDFRNQKQPDGTWVKVPYYAIEDQNPIGNHGDKSVFLIQKFMHLSNEEIAAIRYHMSAFQEGDIQGFSNASSKYPLVIWLHIADMQATYFDENRR
jgi:hypothetical protein